MRPRRPWLVLLLAFSVVSFGRSDASPPADPVPRLWMINGGYYDQVRYQEPEIAHRLLLQRPSVIVGSYHLRNYARGARLKAFSWPSFRWFARGLDPTSCRSAPGEIEFDAFLRCDLIGAAAEHADIVEVQAQALQNDPTAYRPFVLAAATQARDANPGVQVVSGLTTGQVATARQMYAAWASVRDVVDGYYLSIGGNERVPSTLRFLRMLPLPPAA